MKSEAILLKDGRECLVSLGNAHWALLAWPLDVVDTTQDGRRTMSLRLLVQSPPGPLLRFVLSFERCRHFGLTVEKGAEKLWGLEIAE